MWRTVGIRVDVLPELRSEGSGAMREISRGEKVISAIFTALIACILTLLPIAILALLVRLIIWAVVV